MKCVKNCQALDFPVLIPSQLKARPCLSWTFQSLSKILKDKKFSCRVWKKSTGQILETACDHVNVSMKEFCDWVQSSAESDNPLSGYDRISHAGYIDYKYMKDVFSHCPEVLKEVQWDDFGLSDFDGKDSTIWVGSEGSNTPGHQDSYGFNLVTQIQGRKIWILFPPNDTKHLYPTRIPYEESSVFSRVHFGCPNIEKYPAVKASHPVIVILHPGQTLYVPRHWWHYVESLDASISINVWVPHKNDANSHLTESVTRCLATSLLTELQSRTDNSWHSQLLNPTESLCSQSENIHFLKYAIEQVLHPPLTSGKNEQQATDSNNYSAMNEKENSIRDKGHCNYLDRFGCFLKMFHIIQAPADPCLCICKRCEGEVKGCLSCLRAGFSDSVNPHISTENPDKLYFESETFKTESHDRNIFVEKKKTKGIELEDRLVSLKRGNETEENCHRTKRSKQFERLSDSKHFNAMNGKQIENVIGFKEDNSKDITDSSIESTKQSSEEKAGIENHDLFVFSLVVPFSFDHFLHVMKLISDYSKFLKDHSFIGKQYVQNATGKASYCSVCDSRNKFFSNAGVDMKKHCQLEVTHKQSVSSLPSSQITQGPMSSSSTPLMPDNPSHFSKSVQHFQSVQSDPLMNTTATQTALFQSSEGMADQENITTDEVIEKDLVSVSRQELSNSDNPDIDSSHSLTEEELHTLFVDSVLHPSVIEKISNFFKSRCDFFLLNKMKN